MNMFERYGMIMQLQHEGNQQLASALAGSVRALLRRLPKLLAGLHRAPTASSS